MSDRSRDIEALRREYETAQKRIEQQSVTMESFAKNGYQMLKILLLIAGAIVTLASTFRSSFITGIFDNQQCVFQTSFVCLSVNFFGKVGIFTLAGSIATYGFAAGKEARGLGSICTKADINRTLNNSHSEREYLKQRLQRYEDRVEDNDVVINFTESVLAIGGMFLVISVATSTFLLYTIITSDSLGGWLLFLVIVFVFSLFFYMMYRLPERYNSAETWTAKYLLKWFGTKDPKESEGD